jgi:sulfonate transport system permease protein
MNQPRPLTARPATRLSTPSLRGVGLPVARVGRVLRGLLVPVGLLILWQVLVDRGVYTRAQLPAPLDVYRGAKQLWEADLLVQHISISLERVAKGFAIGALVALALGLVVGLSRTVEDLVGPTLQAIRAVPSLAWVPLLLLWMGIDERPKLTLVAIGAFFPIYTNLVAGIRQIDRRLIEAAAAYGLRGPALAWQVLLPAAMPSLFTGLRLGLAQGWLFLVAAELIASTKGLGFLLIDGQNSTRTDLVIFSIIALAVLGKLTDWLLFRAERRLLHWSDAYR